MQAKHVMVSPVITGTADMTVREIAEMLVANRISALPIVGKNGSVVGLVSEGDLIRRAEIGTQKQRSWWLSLFTSSVQLAEEYAHTHARKVKDLMTHEVISVAPDTALSEIARLLEFHRIKRVPVLDKEKLVGIVTRGDLVRVIATASQREQSPVADEEIRASILRRLDAESWTNVMLIDVTVNDGTVNLWGLIRSEAERRAVLVAVENIAGVKAINDQLALEPLPAWV
ncbi:MAG: CBS domain-containing protein [Rhizobiales bacterium]|nr:CBS domain-containing protein [Hyphomicrobiales bacterium]